MAVRLNGAADAVEDCCWIDKLGDSLGLQNLTYMPGPLVDIPSSQTSDEKTPPAATHVGDVSNPWDGDELTSSTLKAFKTIKFCVCRILQNIIHLKLF
uniref:Uncharacterized protein n=1 Tax=Denticeps clupeoides TaxID=299321 RepID=A0AAY4DSE7_9TELE